MTPLQYTPPRELKSEEIVCWRVGEPSQDYDETKLEKYGEIILKVKCSDGMFYLIIRHPETKRGGDAE